MGVTRVRGERLWFPGAGRAGLCQDSGLGTGGRQGAGAEVGMQRRSSSSQSSRRPGYLSGGRGPFLGGPRVPVRGSDSLLFSEATPTGVPAYGLLIYYEPCKLSNYVCKWLVRCLTAGGWVGHVWVCNY